MTLKQESQTQNRKTNQKPIKKEKPMGDRGNIVVRASNSPKDDVWLYTHWSGSDLKSVAKSALTRGKSRWNDPSYLTRIVFDELTEGDRSETGFGISTSIGDNEHPILVIDSGNKVVFFINEDELLDGRIPESYKPESTKTFSDFVE